MFRLARLEWPVLHPDARVSRSARWLVPNALVMWVISLAVIQSIQPVKQGLPTVHGPSALDADGDWGLKTSVYIKGKASGVVLPVEDGVWLRNRGTDNLVGAIDDRYCNPVRQDVVQYVTTKPCGIFHWHGYCGDQRPQRVHCRPCIAAQNHYVDQHVPVLPIANSSRTTHDQHRQPPQQRLRSACRILPTARLYRLVPTSAIGGIMCGFNICIPAIRAVIGTASLLWHQQYTLQTQRDISHQRCST